RRHTRFSRDWSSDVCSSDLLNLFLVLGLDMGMLGVAYSSFISISVFNLLKTFYIKQKFGILPFDHKYSKLFLVIILVGLVVYFFPNLTSNFWNQIGRAHV